MIHIRSTISKLLYLASYDKSINGVLRSLKCHGEKKGGINLGMRIFLTRQKVLLEGYLLMSPSSPVPRRLIWPLLEASCCYVEWRPTFLFRVLITNRPLSLLPAIVPWPCLCIIHLLAYHCSLHEGICTVERLTIYFMSNIMVPNSLIEGL